MSYQHSIQPGPRPYLEERQRMLEPLRWKYFEAKRLSPCLGAELHGIGLGEPLSGDVLEEVRSALLKYRVLFFRDQNLSAEQHLAFARSFGELEEHPFIPSDAPDAEVIRFDKDEKVPGFENVWHSDVSWREVPSLGSVLRAHIVPDIGGDTLFADMVAAYECLNDELKASIEKKKAVNDFTQSFGRLLSPEDLAKQQAKYPAVEHPLVRTHPETGEKSLYANAAFTSHIAGMNRNESDELLQLLFRQSATPEFQCRFKWQKDSIAFWDNRVVQHYAVNDYWPQRRQMDRVTIIGERPV